MQGNRRIWHGPWLIALTISIASAANAGDPKTVANAEWRPDLIARYESDGGRNIPNFRYDSRHTAGGVCQMTDETWREVAPTVDIDLTKFPNAGSASEHQQWQACWKLHALRGNQPWTCCNAQLRKALNSPSPPEQTARDSSIPRNAPIAARPVIVFVNPFLSPSASSAEMVFTLKE